MAAARASIPRNSEAAVDASVDGTPPVVAVAIEPSLEDTSGLRASENLWVLDFIPSITILLEGQGVVVEPLQLDHHQWRWG